MMTLPIFLMAFFFPASDKATQYNFGQQAGSDWRVIVDGVMGGLSSGKVDLLDDSMLFTGSISLDNNGGFSSLRAPFGKYDLRPFQSVEIRYRSSGGTFTFMMEEDRRFWIPYMGMPLPDTGEEWVTIQMNLSQFASYRLGEDTGDKMTEQQKKDIIRIGFMKLDKLEGPFMLEIDYLNFVE